MRRWLCVLTLGMLLAGSLTTVAVAAPPTTTVNDFTSFDCLLSEGDLGGYVFANDSSVFGSAIEVGIGNAFGFSNDVDFDGGSVTGTVELFDFEGQSLGEAVLDATFTPIGEVQTIDERYREGNVRLHDVGFFQDIEVSGTLTALGTVFALSDCFGQTGQVTTTSTSPGAFVEISRDMLSLFCGFETEDAFAFVFAFSDEFGTGAFLDTVVGSGFDDNAVFTTDEFHASFELFDPVTDEPTGETATADATLAAGPLQVTKIDGTKTVARALDVEGTLSVPGLGEFDMSSCEATQVLVEQSVATHLRPLANDLPDDATPISSGDVVEVQQTGGAARIGEAGTRCLGGAPPGYSVWYTLDGTGAEVTLDPTGSNFDTVIAVYTREDEAFTEVACVDDDEDLQGSLTFDTDPGVTYWIQVGSFGNFPGDFGTLRLAVS